MAFTRRAFLVSGGAWVALTAVGGVRAQPSRTRLVLLGTAGGPTPKAKSAGPAQAIVVGDRIYLVDSGDGVARQLALASLPVRQLRAVFITHQHSDHNAGYGPLFRPHEITKPGDVYRDDRVRVTAALNDHPPIEHSFAFRFDTTDRSIVISGDTRYSEHVIALARGADVLVHEVVSREFWERSDAPQPPAVVRHIVGSHTDTVDVGRVAAAAGVRTLVLSHFVPTEGPGAPTDEAWIAGVRRHFKGEVIVGRDLMEI